MMPQVDSSSTKKSTELTLIDKLSRLSYQQTLKLLGSDAPRLLRAGDKWDFRLEEDVYLGPDLFRLKFPPAAGERESERVIVMISLVETSYNRLQWHCTACESLCEHVGAAFAFILDEKMTLGLAGDKWDFRLEEDVYLGPDLFRLKFPPAPGERESERVIVMISLVETSYNRLQWHCTACESLCEHVGAAFAFILDEKMTLGLAVPPPERVPVESLTEEELIRQAIDERRERARAERMTVKSADPVQPWTDFAVSSTVSGKTYRVAVRGREPGSSYCSCPDFRTNTLGTCKHILHVLAKLSRRFTAAQLKRPYTRKTVGIHVQYRDRAALRLLLPEKLDSKTRETLEDLRGRDIDDVSDLLRRIQGLERQGRSVNIYPDAEELIHRRLLLERIARRVAEIRIEPESHRLRRGLLKAELLPYQLDGIAFAAGAGRAVLADEMGLGKTIQAIGVAELLAREAGISKVLVVCPASVKSQWRSEIRRFCDRDCQLICGSIATRGAQDANEGFFN